MILVTQKNEKTLFYRYIFVKHRQENANPRLVMNLNGEKENDTFSNISLIH